MGGLLRVSVEDVHNRPPRGQRPHTKFESGQEVFLGRRGRRSGL
eukprot:CAMPEP_0115159210 /NCGR_PEP_ID=MMETSP0227-20121206/70057_1 /TAXON_ID=89957 /ORGANISM="Polarella glacialis, Strain CCMP 1383" /LENGTH=43 /DNA_ID= /DNA_START= /DNA_END= /DNA_ORIENTATION=